MNLGINLLSGELIKTILTVFGAILIFIALSFVFCNIRFKKKANNEIKELFQKSKKTKIEIITEKDIKNLPDPVQRYLRYTQTIGKKKINNIRLKQKGFIRSGKGEKWMPFKAEQYYTTNPPAFIWHATVKPTPFISIKARDKFWEGKGNMLIKLFGIKKIADAIGYEMDQGTLIRYLNEIMWFPSAYMSEYIQWDEIDSNSVKAKINYKGVTADAVIYFNKKGEITNFVAKRYRDVGGKFVMENWSTPIEEYKKINGMILPVKGKGVWNLSSGDVTYIKLEVIDIEYNIH